jgi:hypothetical protein
MKLAKVQISVFSVSNTSLSSITATWCSVCKFTHLKIAFIAISTSLAVHFPWPLSNRTRTITVSRSTYFMSGMVLPIIRSSDRYPIKSLACYLTLRSILGISLIQIMSKLKTRLVIFSCSTSFLRVLLVYVIHL